MLCIVGVFNVIEKVVLLIDWVRVINVTRISDE